jgi:intracellular septation protein A
MKILIIGLFPVLIFWFVEEKFGTLWGLVAAIIWAIGECLYEYLKFKRIEKLTIFSTSLVVLLGGLGIWLENGILFKFQPVIVESVFAGILYFGGRRGEPVMFQMARKTRPEIFLNKPEEALQHQRLMMGRLTNHLIVILLLHSVLLAYLALRGTTGQWAFWKGIGFNLFLVIWVVGEFGVIKLRGRER